jgi:hypothetical protein
MKALMWNLDEQTSLVVSEVEASAAARKVFPNPEIRGAVLRFNIWC